MADLVIRSPENSFIQFTRLDAEAATSCFQLFTTCLPIHLGTDYAFEFYVEGEVPEEQRDNYVVRLVTQDDLVESNSLVITWFYDAVNDITWGTVKNPISSIAPFIGEVCMNYKIFVNVIAYQYFSIIETWGNPMTASLVIDGVTTPFFSGTAASLVAFIADIQTYLDFLDHDATAVLTTATGMQITNNDGHTYGDLVIDESGPNTYSPTSPDPELTAVYISNCLAYVENTCFTRVVKYRGNENQFGFNYALDTAFYNIVRLPVWIEKPVPIIDENYFTLSDGTKKVLAASYQKEYDGHTEYFNEADHFRFVAALKHDTFLMGDTVTTVEEYSAEGKYDIGWFNLPGTPIGNAPASFKVRPTPFYMENSNCVNT